MEPFIEAKDVIALRRALRDSAFPYPYEREMGISRYQCLSVLDRQEAEDDKYLENRKALLMRVLFGVFWLIIISTFVLIVLTFTVRHFERYIFYWMLPLYGFLFYDIYLMNRVKNMTTLPQFMQQKKAAPSEELVRIKENLNDCLAKYDTWAHGSAEERDNLLEEFDEGYLDFRDAVMAELQHPSEDCALGDVRFGMTLDELYETKAFKGLPRSEKPAISPIRSRFLGEIVGISNPLVCFNMNNGRLENISLEYIEIIRNLFMMDEERAEEQCQQVKDYIREQLKPYYGPSCCVGKKFIDIVYSQFERPRIFFRNTDFS